MSYCTTTIFCHTLTQLWNLQMAALALLWMWWHILHRELESHCRTWGSGALCCWGVYSPHTSWVCRTRSGSQQWVVLSPRSKVRCWSQYNVRVSGHPHISPLLAPCYWLIAGDISSHQLSSQCYQFLLVSREVSWIQPSSSRDLSQPKR